MKKYVFTVKEDICNENGKDVTAANLLEKMLLYGTVEDYEDVVAASHCEHQAIIDNLKAQYEAIKDQKLTSEEIKLVNSYREIKAISDRAADAKIQSLTKQLADITAEFERRIERIKAVIG